MSDFLVSPELLTIYLEDARQHIESLDHCLLTLEREGVEPEAIAAVLGPLHTLKGNSGMMGFTGIKDYAHRLEDVFALVSEGALTLNPKAFDRLFAGATALRDGVEQACREKTEVRDLAPEKEDLEDLIRAAASAPTAPVVPRAPSLPAAGPPASPAPAPASGPGDTQVQHVSSRSNTVRVDFAQLDHLLNLVGELIIYRTKLERIAKGLMNKGGAAGPASAPAFNSPAPDSYRRWAETAGRELLAAVHQVAGVSSELQETVMDVRMLPVRVVFERFPRLVRDLSRQTGKQIELILEGENTRVDKAIIDEIGEPLVHLIRNSVDHGIERPDVRVARGKTPTGTILLSASQESNHVLITIMDDGGGIDAATVRRKAVDRGLLKGDETLSERDIVQLIFAQGFSTREATTDLSGRGVGLDVVIKSIERLNGLVEVETVPGVGTKFIIQLPLTLAIIAALLVEVGARTYAIPLGAVVESLKLYPEEIHSINGRETLRVRDRIIPLIRLAALFGVPSSAGAHEYVVILGRGDKRLGVVVERLQGQQEVVIKPLDAAISGSTVGMAGATIMGDGRVVLILDVAPLFENKRMALLHGSAEPAAAR